MSRLITRQGKDRGWAKMDEEVVLLADWFDQYRPGIAPKQPSALAVILASRRIASSRSSCLPSAG